MLYYIYAGYYEIYVTNKRLKKPYVQVYTAESIQALNAYLMDVDDWLFIDKDIYKNIDSDYNCLFEVKNGLPVVLKDSDNEI